MKEQKFSPFTTSGPRESFPRESFEVEERVQQLLYKVPRPKPLTHDQLEQLHDLSLSDRLELGELSRIVEDVLNAHLSDLHKIKTILSQKPKIRAATPGLTFNDVQIQDIISKWEHPRRVYYYVLQKSSYEPVIRVVRLKKNLELDGRTVRSFTPSSEKISSNKLKLYKIEKRNVSPFDIGADSRILEQWKSSGFPILNE